jgi:hypothetical protein
MTGLDGLIDARKKQIEASLAANTVRRLPGSDLADRSETTLEWWMHKFGKAEEIAAKTVGNIFSDDPKYDAPLAASNYHTQVGFADVARTAGLGPYASLVVG